MRCFESTKQGVGTRKQHVGVHIRGLWCAKNRNRIHHCV